MLDVDGVLVTGRPFDGKPWHTNLQSDLGIDPDWFRRAFFTTLWTEIVEGRESLMPSLQGCLEDGNIETTAEEFVDYWYKMDSRIDKVVLADFQRARVGGLAVYLATNQEHCRAEFLMNIMGLAAHVDGIIYSAKLGSRKPDTAFYIAASKDAGCEESSILLVDDTLENVVAARKVGWQAVHWDKSRTLEQIIQDFA